MTNRGIRIAGGVLAATLAGTAALYGHAVVFPRTSAPGAYEKYVLRVPNERPVPTREVRLSFPPSVRVVSFGDVPGWKLTVQRDSTNRVAGAVWEGEIGVERFAEFPFVAVNPRAPERVSWNAVQVYANGEQVEWTGPEESSTPASVTDIRPAETGPSSRLPLMMSAAALVISVIGLGLALRK